LVLSIINEKAWRERGGGRLVTFSLANFCSLVI
jgi:hypothetical protein